MEQVIIAIGREFASGGHDVARLLAQHYGISLYDKNLLKEIADKKNIDHESLEEFDERRRNKLLYRSVRGMSSSPSENLANMQFDFLREKAASGESFVIVGRCAEAVLKDEPSLISIFVTADMEYKLFRVERDLHLTGTDAKIYIETENMKRKYYHNSHCKNKWGDARFYDLTINSDKLGIHKTVELLVDYIDSRMAKREEDNKKSK